MILGLHHAALSTPDLARLVAFYRDLLGFELVSEMAWGVGSRVPDTILGLHDSAARQALLRSGRGFVELFEFASPVPRPRPGDRRVCDHGYTHVCLHVSDLAGEVARLRAAGVGFESEPVVRPTHASVYGRDPDGNVFELLEVFDAAHPYAPPLGG